MVLVFHFPRFLCEFLFKGALHVSHVYNEIIVYLLKISLYYNYFIKETMYVIYLYTYINHKSLDDFLQCEHTCIIVIQIRNRTCPAWYIYFLCHDFFSYFLFYTFFEFCLLFYYFLRYMFR